MQPEKLKLDSDKQGPESAVENSGPRALYQYCVTLPIGYFYFEIFNSNLSLDMFNTKHTPSSGLSFFQTSVNDTTQLPKPEAW